MRGFARKPICLTIMVSVASLLVYGSILDSFFLSDDFSLLYTLQNHGPGALWWAGAVFLRPLVSVSLAIDLFLWGLSPIGFHVHNVLIHGLCALLTGVVAVELGRRLDRNKVSNWRWAGPLAALIFLVAPSHAETVSWISGRTDLYATLFVLFALVAHLRVERGPGRRIAAAVFYGLALASKESAASAPLLFFVIEQCTQSETVTGRTRWANSLRRAAPYFAVLAMYGLARWILLDHPLRGPGVPVPGLVLLMETLVIDAAKSVLAYWPLWLLPFRDALRANIIPVSIFVLVALSGGLLFLRRSTLNFDRFRTPFFCAAAWFVLLLPAVLLPTRLFTSESDRFLYLPSVFVAIGLAGVIESFLTSRRARVLAGGVVILLYFSLLQRANANWEWAGETSRRVLSEIVDGRGSSQIAVLCAPDNLRGAYIFRNGLPQAVALFSPPGSQPGVSVLSTLELPARSVSVVVADVGGAWLLTASSPVAIFRSTRAPLPPCLRLADSDAQRDGIRVDSECGSTVDLLVYDNRSLRSIR